nr:sugar phosphate isomerase/epimerase [Clostridia bacterium]
MKDYKLGIQIHSVREAFAEDPAATLKRVREIGYTGVELTISQCAGRPAEFFRQALKDADLECYGMLTSWSDVQDDKIDETIAYNNAMGSGFLVIGSVPKKLVSTESDAMAAIAKMNDIYNRLSAQGIVTGYHNHDSDHTNIVGGKSFFEHVFDNTPEGFVMLLDTGNALAGGCESIPALKKYPNRSPYLHIKGYSEEKGYLAYIGQDDFDWPAVIRCALDVGGAKVFDVEFGKRADYDPFERAADGFRVVSSILADM